jgi:hypothetical protein
LVLRTAVSYLVPAMTKRGGGLWLRFLRWSFALYQAVSPGDLGWAAARLLSVWAHLRSAHAGDPVQAHSGCHASRQVETELPSVDVYAESRHRWQPLVKG